MRKTIETLKTQVQNELIEQSKKALSMDGLKINQELAKNWLTLDDVWIRLGYAEPEPGTVCRLTDDQIKCWNDNMMNTDGTKGGHWTVEQTSAVAASIGVCFDHVTDKEYNVTMNMMYSDYYDVAKKNNAMTATFFGEMAKAFLFDPDGGKPYEKLGAYYNYVVKPNMKW